MVTKCVVSTHPPVSVPYGTSGRCRAPFGSLPKCRRPMVTDLPTRWQAWMAWQGNSECHLAS
eukprot:13708878-Alexandrium_andersonii.AAC.1